MRVNMTLCFSQEQAAAVYAATSGSKQPVYVSPFVGRLDDHGEDGMDLIKNIKKMYEHGDGHVHVLAASIRGVNHLLYSFALSAELATVPGKVLEEWAAKGFPLPDRNFTYRGVDANDKSLKAIPYKELDLNLPWQSFDIAHELTKKGIQKFVADYQSTLKRSGIESADLPNFPFADHPGVSPQVGLIVLLAETLAGSAPHPEMAGLQRDGCIRG
jgi:transaldolase